MPPNRVKAPGNPGTAARVFGSEAELAEATRCPFAMFDGTTCNGPACMHWHAEQINHPGTAAPLFARIACAAFKRPRRMGHVKPQQEGGAR